MGQHSKIPAEVKQQILHRIRTEGLSVAQAAKDHGISAVTIYEWLKRSVDLPSSILQINKLKRENEELQRLLGKVILEIERSKKNPSHHGFSR